MTIRHQDDNCGDIETFHMPRSRRLIAWVTLLAYVGQPLVATAQTIADQAAAPQNRPVIDTTANGRPLVQIATPSAAGVSRNQYTQYNVDSKGLILNNSQGTVQTQLGGYVQGNPYLANGSAKIILNEVTGTGASSLNGYTEVAGQRAEVVVANPNGINCNGCGFINASRGVLTTGVPIMGGSGSLDAFRVTGGQIQIGAGGLNGSNLAQLDLIARSVKVNGQLWADTLNVVTGANRVNYADLGVQVIQGNGGKPTVGIDVALLGGMYANKIRLIGTEAGVGVNSLGTLAAQAGDFTLDSRGQITLSGSTSAAGNLDISGHDGIANGGLLGSRQNVQLTSQGDIANSGTALAQGNLSLNGANIHSSGTLGAGIDAGGHVTQAGDLNLAAAGRIDVNGQNLAGGNLALSGAALNLANSRSNAGGNVGLNATGGDLDLSGGALQAGGTATLGAAGSVLTNQGQIAAAQFGMAAHGLANRGGSIVQTGSGATVLDILGQLDNSGGAIETNSTNLLLTPQTLINDNGKITHAGPGVLTINTGVLSNVNGFIGTNGQAGIRAASIANRGGKLSARKQATLTSLGALDNSAGGYIGADSLAIYVDGLIDNTGGSLAADSRLSLSGQRLVNDNGNLSSSGKANIDLTGMLANTSGNIQSDARLGIVAGGLDNSAGRIVSLNADGLSLGIGGLLINQTGATAQGKVGGLIGGNGNVAIAAGSIGNAGSITAGGDLGVASAGIFDNGNGLLAAGGSLAVRAGSVIMNHQGSMAGNALATFNATQLDNSGGSIYAGQLGVAVHDLFNRGGQFAQGGVGATAFNVLGMFDNGGGRIRSNGSDLRLVSQTLVNDGGTIAHAGQGTLSIVAGTLGNAGGNIGTNGRINVAAGSIGNRGGSITAQQQAVIAGRGNLDNGAGYIGADSLNLAVGGQVDNIGGGLAANNGIVLSGLRLFNSGGYIRNSGASALGISLVQDLVNHSSANGNGGYIGGNGDLAVSSAALDNGGGTLYGKGRVALQTRGAFVNRNGLVQSDGGIGIAATGALDNGSGRIEANGAVGTLNLAAASIDNTLGRIANAGTGDSVIDGGSSIVNTGLIGTNGNLDVAAGLLRNNAQGQLLSGNRLNLNVTGKLDNANGTVYAWGDLAFDRSAATLDNTAGEIASGGNGSFTLAGIANGGGKIAANGNLGLISAMLTGNGKVLAGGNETVSLQGDYTNGAGNVFSANGDLAFNVAGNLTNQTALQALGRLSVSAANIANQAGASFNASHTSLTASGSIVNDGRIDGGLIDTSSRDFTNNGSVIGDRVALTANNLTNQGAAAVIAATSNVDLWIGNQLSNLSGAEIYSMGNLAIAANASMDAAGNFTRLTQHILNEGDSQAKSSLIEAGGNINIGAVNLDNRRPQLATTNVVRSVTTQTLTPPLDYTKKRRGWVPLMSALLLSPPTHTQFFTQDIYGLNTAAGSFSVVGNEPISKAPTVYYDSISPTAVYGYLYQGTRSVRVSRRGSKTVTVTQLINQSDIASSSVNTYTASGRRGWYTVTTYTVTLNNGQTLTFNNLLKQGWYYDVTYYPGYDPHVNTHPSQLQSSWVMSEQSRTVTTAITDQVIQSAVPMEARISAGGNLNVNLAGTLTNYISSIAAGGNITVSGSTTANGAVSNARIVNQGQQLTRTVSTSGSAYLFGYYDCGGFWGGSCGIDSTVALTPTSTVSVLGSSPSASITAGGSIQAHVGVVANRASGAGAPLAGSTLGSARDVVVARSNASSAIVDGGQARIGAVSGGIQAMEGGQGLAQTSRGAVSVAANGAAQISDAHGRRNNGELPAIVLPASGLYAIHSRPDQHYLVETDPRFTNYKNFVSSDYMMSRLSMDPQKMQKRLGDGFYEQRLVADQITQLTGRRYLGQYASADAQYRALMDAGVDAAKQLALAPGIALSGAQVAALNQDIVWLVNRQVILADGSSQTVLAPVIYLSRNHAIDLKPNGALIAANDVNLKADGTLQNSGVIRGVGRTVVAANDIVNRGGSIGSAGGDTLLQAGNDILNQSGRIAGNRVALVAGRNIANTTLTSDYRVGNDSYGASNTFIADTATIAAGGSLVLDAIGNVDLAGAKLQSGGDTLLHAGGSLNVDAIVAKTSGRANNFYSHYNTDKITHLGSSLQAGGNLSLVAANDLKLTAAALDAGGNASLLAGGKLKLAALKDSSSLDSAAIGDGSYALGQRYDETVKGSSVQSGGNLTLAAGTVRRHGGDLILESAQLSSQNGNANLMAGGDIALTSVGERHRSYDLQHTESSGLLSSSSTTTIAQSDLNQAVGSSVSGNRVDVLAGHDIRLDGGSIAGSGDVALNAGHDINLKAATSTYSQSYYSHTEESGFLSGGGFGITYGNRSQTDQSNTNGSLQSQNRSLVGSIGGNLSLTAGNNAHVSGSDLVAGNDLNVVARSITLDTGLDRNDASQMHDFKQSGLTLSLSSPVLAAAQTARQMAHAAGQTKDGRVKALAAASAGLSAYNAYNAVQAGQTVMQNGKNVANAADKMGGINVSISLGNSSSHSDSQQQSTANFGSSARAGHDLNLIATGAGKDSNLTALGADIRAGNNASLIADNAINLLAAQNTSNQISHNNSSSNSIGVGFSLGGQSNGFTLNIAASRARGNADGHDLTNVNTHATAGNQLTLSSGGDTTLKGAVASGKQVVADVGGNLDIQSLQDTSVYNSKQSSAGFSMSLCIPPFCYGASSVDASFSNNRVNGNYASVVEQSGIKAGDGGFNINVASNTALTGAVIESTARASQTGSNHLSTGTLTVADIQNHSNFSGDSMSLSGGFSGSLGDQSGNPNPPPGGAKDIPLTAHAAPPLAMSANGRASSTTRSGISGGDISIANDAKQKELTGKDAAQTVAGLNRDVATGKDNTGALKNDLATHIQDMQVAFAVTQAFGQQVGTFLNSQAQQADAKKAQADKAEQAANDPNNGLNDPQRQALRGQAAALRNQAQTITDNWGPGGTYRQIATALTAAASGNVTGGMGQLVQGAAVNYIQSLGVEKVKAIADSFQKDGKNTSESESVRAALHGILACAGASAQGGDCSSGALGASAGSVINSLMGGDPKTMTAQEKENRKNLVTSLVAGIATTTGAQASTATSAAQMETENNYLKPHEIVATDEKLRLLQGDKAAQKVVIDEAKKKSEANDKALQSDCAANPNSAACQKHVQDALNYAGDQNATSGISGAMGEDIKRSRTVVLDQTLNGGSYGAVNNIETRADFFGAMKQQTGAPWFKTAEDVSRNDLQGTVFGIGNILTGGQASQWRETAGTEIMKNGADNFRSIYNNPKQDESSWSRNQLAHEQNDPQLQPIHQQYLSAFPLNVLKPFIEIKGGVSGDMLNPVDRIKTGCIKMGMASDCGVPQQ